MKFDMRLMRLRAILITDWVTHCRTSQKITFKSSPYSEYSATSMSCNEGTLFKLRMFLVGVYEDQTFIGFSLISFEVPNIKKQFHIAYY